MSTQTIKVSIVLPGKFSRHDNGEKISEPLKFCPCCGCELVPLLDKHSPVTSPPGGPEGGHSQDGSKDSTATRGGSYCAECGTQLMYNDKASTAFNGDLVTAAKPPDDDEISQANTDSLTRAVSLTHLGKMLDEEYKTWEDRLQAEFQAFLLSVRSHFQKKEKTLQEYQIDLCQREKELQNSEEIYQQKILVLRESEEELKQRMESARESVSLQLENKVSELRKDCQEMGVQTDPIQIQEPRSDVQQSSIRKGVKDEPDGSYGLFIKSPPNPALKMQNLSSPPQGRQYTQGDHYYASDQAPHKDYQRGLQQGVQDSRRPEIPKYNQSYAYSQKPTYHSPPTKPSYQPHPGGAYSAGYSHAQYTQQQLSPDSGYNQYPTYSQPKPPSSSFQQSPAFSQSPNSSQLESLEPQDQSSSSNVPAPRAVTSPAGASLPSRSADQPDGASEFQQFQRSRLGRPPPPPGHGGTGGYPQRYDRRSQSAEVLDTYPPRAQSPSPERENQRSFSADKVESPRMRRHEVPRSQSAERLLDNGYNHGGRPMHQDPPPSRKQAPPYNGPPAYSKHAPAYNYTSPPNHSRESSVNGHGEGAIIESRTLDVQVARSKSVTDSLPSPKEKTVKFGVAVFPAKTDGTSYSKSPFPRTESGEAEPDMTSTPVESKEVVFPEAQAGKHDRGQLPQARPNEGYGYAPSKAQASRIASPPSRLPPGGGGYRYSTTPGNVRPQQSTQIPEGAKPSPYSKYSTPPSSNLRRPTSATPNRQQIPQRTGVPRMDGPQQMVQRRTPQNYAQQPDRTSKEINNNRPISDYADDEVFISDSPPPTLPAKSPYASSKLRPPNSSERKSRNITSHHKSRIAQSSRSLSGSKNSNGIPRGIPQPGSYQSPQQPEPQQPVRQNYNQNNMADTSNMANNSTLADDSLSSSILSNSKNRHFDFSPTYKALYSKYHPPGTVTRTNDQSERKRQQELERQHEAAKSPTWRSRSRLPNYGKYISEIQEVPVPTKILDH